MTTVLALVALNAAAFESGNAPDTHALFSKGDGTSEWREPREALSVAPAGSVFVSAGAAGLTGLYEPLAQRQYAFEGVSLAWSSKNSRWILGNLYYSSDDVATPDLITTWVDQGGGEPLPSVIPATVYPSSYILVSSGAGDALWATLDSALGTAALPDPAGHNEGSGLVIGNGVPVWQPGVLLPELSKVPEVTIEDDGKVLTAVYTPGFEEDLAVVDRQWQTPAGGGGAVPSYAVYSALLTQSGTDAPVATVLENTLGEIVWTRNDDGFYLGTLDSAFPETKTFCMIQDAQNISNGFSFEFARSSNSTVYVYNDGGGMDGQLMMRSIEIRVYGVSVGGSGGVPSVVGASDGDVLTVASGVAAWETPAGGGVPYLGALENGGDPPTSATITAAFETIVGRSPRMGDTATMLDMGNDTPVLLFYYEGGTPPWSGMLPSFNYPG